MYSFNPNNKSKLLQNVRIYHQVFNRKRSKLTYPPLWVTVGITGHCAFKCLFCCSHCPESGSNPVTSHQYKVPYLLSFKDYKQIVKMCHEARVPHVHICGTGEPFLHPDILDFIDYLSLYYPNDITLQTDFYEPLFKKKNYVDEIILRKEHIRQITTDIFPIELHNKIKRGSNIFFLLDCMEHICQETKIRFDCHVILSKESYKGIPELIKVIAAKKINATINIVNLYPLGFNSFTSKDNVYYSSDLAIADELKRATKVAKKLNIEIKVPEPWDMENKENKGCEMFWQKVQFMPTKKIKKELWPGNAIPQQCAAVVRGNLYTTGNLLQYNHFMDFWNNETNIKIRQDIINGKLPDQECINCPTGNYGKFKKISKPEKLILLLPEPVSLIILIVIKKILKIVSLIKERILG